MSVLVHIYSFNHHLSLFCLRICNGNQEAKFSDNIHLAENSVTETVALEVEDEPVEVDISPRTLFEASMKVGLMGLSIGPALLRSKTTTSDMVGLAATVDWVQSRAILITLFTSSELYSSWFSDSSTNLINSPFSYNFHACSAKKMRTKENKCAWIVVWQLTLYLKGPTNRVSWLKPEWK